jgi:hypothetical protein
MRLVQGCQRDKLTFVFYLRGANTFSICRMASREGVASMTNEYDISLATPDDVSGIIALQEPNLPANGGTLSVRQPADWFTKAILEKSVLVARRDGKVVGYVLGTSLAANAHIPIIQAMLSAYPGPSECYLYAVPSVSLKASAA